MPLLFVILAAICCLTLSLPDAQAQECAISEPDFSKSMPESLSTLSDRHFQPMSLGMGILIPYSSYYPANTRLGSTSLTVSLLSILVAIMMGLVIFPAVKSFGLDDEPLRGATLVFVTLPEVFAQLPMPRLWSSLFFYCFWWRHLPLPYLLPKYPSPCCKTASR